LTRRSSYVTQIYNEFLPDEREFHLVSDDNECICTDNNISDQQYIMV